MAFDPKSAAMPAPPAAGARRTPSQPELARAAAAATEDADRERAQVQFGQMSDRAILMRLANEQLRMTAQYAKDRTADAQQRQADRLEDAEWRGTVLAQFSNHDRAIADALTPREKKVALAGVGTGLIPIVWVIVKLLFEHGASNFVPIVRHFFFGG